MRSFELRRQRSGNVTLIDAGIAWQTINAVRRSGSNTDCWETSFDHTHFVPVVNHLGSYGRWAFAEFCDVDEIQSDL